MDIMALLSADNADFHRVTLCRSEQRISTEMAGETVVLDLDSGVYSGLDEVASFIWSHLDKPIIFADLVQLILAEYDVSEEQCTVDLLAFLQEMAKNKLVTADDC